MSDNARQPRSSSGDSWRRPFVRSIAIDHSRRDLTNFRKAGPLFRNDEHVGWSQKVQVVLLKVFNVAQLPALPIDVEFPLQSQLVGTLLPLLIRESEGNQNPLWTLRRDGEPIP